MLGHRDAPVDITPVATGASHSSAPRGGGPAADGGLDNNTRISQLPFP